MSILTELSSVTNVFQEQMIITAFAIVLPLAIITMLVVVISKMTAEQKITLLNRFIKKAIYLAEAEFGAGKGKEKKLRVLEYLRTVPPFPINVIFSLITIEQLDALIEHVFKLLLNDPNDFVILNPTQKSQTKK